MLRLQGGTIPAIAVLLSQKRSANEVAPDALRIIQANVHGQRGDTMSAAELLLLVLVVASLVGVVLQYLLIRADRRRKRRRYQEMLVVPTVARFEDAKTR